MSWMEDVSKSIQYIETHIIDSITIDDIAKEVNLSPFYFQKGFALVCGITVGEYIRNRRLSLAGRDLQLSDSKVIDIAYKYQYDSVDGFSKAFTRFHGFTPKEAKEKGYELKYFSPLKMQINIIGGFNMEVKIVKKPAFTVVGYSKLIDFNNGYNECPKFWDDHYMMGRNKVICGMYGICIDESANKFKYMICDDYVPAKDYPNECETFILPEKSWAVFKSVGPIPNALQEVNTKIFKEWLPGNPDYVIDGGYDIEYYTDSSLYEKGLNDEKYVCEIWIPVKKK